MPLIVTGIKAPVLGGLLAITLAAAALLPASADDPTPPAGYPSWDDVQKAQSSETAKAGEISRINGLLAGLQAESEAAGATAVSSAAGYASAQAALEAATARVQTLSAEAARANGQLASHRKALGALAVQSYKTGGTNAGFFVALDALEANTAQGFNLVQLAGDKTAALVAKAAAAGKVAASLADQETAAKAERERLAGEAKAKLEAARSAQEALARQVAEEKQHGDELTAQLASLKGTTAAIEGQYRQGQAALAAYEAAQAAKHAAAEEQARRQAEEAAAAAARQPKAPPAAAPAPAPPGSPANPVPDPSVPDAPPVAAVPSPPPVVVPSLPGSAVNDPAGAKNYASGRLGAYGWGQEQFQCLAQLWTKESGWLTTATNPYSGAYGIAQALPPGKYASAGSDWLTSYRTQVDWGLGYIRDRYATPCGAWSHSVALNWY
ncbi:aggregation-promoting factor C-terminal-like domain-containing protein [Arthrobacter sp. C152]